MCTSSQYINIIGINQKWCVPFSFKPSWFTWTLLVAYSKAKLKSSGNRASPCFKPFLLGNLSDTFSPIRTLLYISVRLILINLTSFLGIPNSRIILYDLSPNWIISFLEVYKERMNYFIVFPFFLKHLANAEYMINGPEYTRLLKCPANKNL